MEKKYKKRLYRLLDAMFIAGVCAWAWVKGNEYIAIFILGTAIMLVYKKQLDENN